MSCKYVLLSGEEFGRYIIYHLDVHTPRFRLLNTFIRPASCREFSFKNGLLAIGWEANGSYFVNIHRVSCSPNECEEVTLNIGPAGISVRLFSSPWI